MFERYDEPARRTLFFARYAASDLGSRSIEGEHLLLGLIREPKGLAASVLSALPLMEIRKDLEGRHRGGQTLPVSVEIHFSAGAKHVLEFAMEEADRLGDRHIGTEHLLLGLLREKASATASALAKHGVHLDTARERVREAANRPAAKVVSSVAARAQIAHMVELVAQLREPLSADERACARLDLLLMDLEALKSLLDDQP